MHRRPHLQSMTIAISLVAWLTANIAAEPVEPPRPRNVAILVYEGVELLDFAGPAEVLARARDNDLIFFNVYLIAAKAGEINTAQSVTLAVNHSIDNCPPPDILIIPGGEIGAVDDATRQWIRQTSERTEITMSVCNGAFVLAELGMLDGLDITTFWSFTGWLQDAVPTARVHTDVRLCDNGHIVTTAGISAGIDGSLHLVERLCGEDIAFATARGMEYDWHPTPLDASSPGGSVREIARRAARASSYRQWGEAAQEYESLLAAAPDHPRAARNWGEALLGLGREQDAIAAFEHAAKADDQEAFVWDRLGRLYSKAGQHARSAECFAHAIDHGWIYPNIRCRLAAAYNQAGDPERAIEALQAALSQQWPDMPNLLLDPGLASLHGDERFRAMMRDHAPSGSIQVTMPDEPGERITISGIVLDASGSPVPGALVSVYQTDATGKYAATDDATKMNEPHSRIFGFVRTGTDGAFKVTTIRPAGYPSARLIAGAERYIPAHVHLDVAATGRDVLRKQMVFADDPRMDAHWQGWASELGQPVANPQRNSDGSWDCQVTLTLPD